MRAKRGFTASPFTGAGKVTATVDRQSLILPFTYQAPTFAGDLVRAPLRFVVGNYWEFLLQSVALPTAALGCSPLPEESAFPPGLRFRRTTGSNSLPNGNGRLYGTPLPGSGGPYEVAVAAGNDLGSTEATYPLTVYEPAKFTEPLSATIEAGESFNISLDLS